MKKGLLFVFLLFTSFCFLSQEYLTVAYSPVGAFIHSSSIEVGGNETYVIADGSFVLNETIVVRENGTLIIENAVVEFNMSSRAVIQTYDNATVAIVNSTIFHVLGYCWVYLYDLSVSSVDASFFDEVYLVLYGNSTASVNDSTFTYDIEAYYYSVVSVIGCEVLYIGCYGHSVVSLDSTVSRDVYVYDYSICSITNSEVSYRLYLEFEDDSEVSLVALPTGSIIHWNLYEDNIVSRAYVNLTISSSWVEVWRIYIYDTSVVSLEDSTIDRLYAYGTSTVSVLDSAVIDRIYAYDNSTASVVGSTIYRIYPYEFSTVSAVSSTIEYLYPYDSSNTSIIDSTISNRIYLEFEHDSNLSLSLPTGYVSYWNLYADNEVVKAYVDLTLQNSEIIGWGTVYVYDSSVVSLEESTMDGLYASHNTTISLLDSIVRWSIDCYDFSVVSVQGSTMDGLYVRDNSAASVLSSAINYLYAYDNSTISLADSTVNYNVYVCDYSTGLVTNSRVSSWLYLEFGEDSEVSLVSLPSGSIAQWNLYEDNFISRAYINLTVSSSWVKGWGVYVRDTSMVSLEDSTIDNIYAYDDSTASVVASTINSLYAYGFSTVSAISSTIKNLYSFDSSNTSVIDSVISSRIYLEFENDSDVALSLLIGYVSYWNLYADNVVVKAYFNLTLQNSEINGWGTIYVRDLSVVSLADSTIDGLSAYDNTTISLLHSTIGYLYLYQFSNTSVHDSAIDGIYAYDNSTLSLGSTVRYLYAYEYSTVSVSQSQIEYLYVYDHSTVSLTDCTIIYQVHLKFISDSNVSLALPLGFVSHWNLYENATVTRAYINLTMRKTKIRGWGTVYIYDSSVSLTDSILYNIYSYGSSRVTLEDSFLEYVSAYDYSNVSITDSVVYRTMYLSFRSDSDVSLTSLSSGQVKYWNLYKNNTVVKAYVDHTVQNSWIGGWAISAYDDTTVSLTDSSLNGVDSYDSSTVSVLQCTVDYIGGYGHSTVSLVDSTVSYDVYVYDYSTWSVTDSEFSSRLYLEFEEDSHVSLASLPTGLVDRWNLYRNGTVEKAYINLTMQNTSIDRWRFYVRGPSILSLADSTIDRLYAYDASTVSVLDSAVTDRLYAYDTSIVSVLGSSVEYLYAYEYSTTSVGSTSSQSIIDHLYAYDSCTASITNSIVAIVYGYEDSAVQLVNCTSGVIHIYENAKVFVGWFLDVHVVDSIGKDIPSANVTATYPDATVAAWTLTDANGWARLTLIEKMMNATGSYPVGSYTVTATYEVHLGEESVNMTDNKQLTIALPFIIPELPTFLLLPILIVVTLVAIAFQKRIQRKKMKPFHVKTST